MINIFYCLTGKISVIVKTFTLITTIILFFLLSFSNLKAELFRLDYSKTQINLMFAQSATDNWKQGKSQSFEALLSGDLQHSILIDTFRFRSHLNISYGTIFLNNDKSDDYQVLPTENKLVADAILSYPIGWKVDPFISLSINTQISESFKNVNNENIRTASFRDPISILESLGFEFYWNTKKEMFTSNLGISFKQIRAKYHFQLTDDRQTKQTIEKYLTESGINWKTYLQYTINENSKVKSMLDIYSSFENLNIWSIKLSNELQLKIHKKLSILVTLNLEYDDKQIRATQYNQKLSIGMVFNF